MTTRREFWLALCCAAQLRAQDEAHDKAVFTALAQDVPVDTAVTRSQRPLTGLHAEDFVLLDNGDPRPIRAVTAEELPLDLVLIFQTIPQVRLAGQMRARLLNGASSVLLHTRPDDRVAFLTHTDPIHIELPFTNDRDAMATTLRRIAAMEYSPGFSEQLTIEYAVRMLAAQGPAPGRRRLIVRVGSIVVSGLSFMDDPVIRRLWSENVIYSSIETYASEGDFNPGFKPNQFYAHDSLLGTRSKEPNGPRYREHNTNHIAQATGGDAIGFLDPKDPQDLVTRMRQRYVLWFTQPADLEPGQPRRISVDLSPEVRRRYPDAVVRARAGYITQ